MNNKKNLFSALLYQITHIVYGLVVPRLILNCFGSEINGLVSSIAQFLSFITLLEGGLGAVVLAELYAPIEKNDCNAIREILYSCQKFFLDLAKVYIFYTVLLGIVYAYIVRDKFDITFTISLVMILSLITLAQYLFSITLKLFLQADQRIYINNLITTSTLIINTIIAFLVIEFFPEIRFLKLMSSVAFFIQPLIFRRFIPKEYIDFNKNREPIALKNRWSGFSQNLAHYINMNTDIVLITIFCSLTDVSIYSVYMLGINTVRSIVSYATNSYQSAIGKYLVQNDNNTLNKEFKNFCICTWGFSLILYSTCLLMVNPFVALYTNRVSDANYYQPIFAMVIIVANLVYCLREPYRLLILAAGKFKETNFGAVMEAFLNIAVSLLLIKPLGMTGVAIGTLIAILYRMIYFIAFLNKGLMKLRCKEYLRYIASGVFIVVFNMIIYLRIHIVTPSFANFCLMGAALAAAESVFVLIFFFGKKDTEILLKKLIFIK